MQLCRPWFRATRVQLVTTPAMYLKCVCVCEASGHKRSFLIYHGLLDTSPCFHPFLTPSV